MTRPQSPHAFDEYVGRYDAWYDTARGRVLLAVEVECLQPLLQQLPGPYLEVGVGTGRFAEALGIEYGLDPSLPALKSASSRGVAAVLGKGEALPFPGASFGGVLMTFTLCFLRDPFRALQETRRVLAPSGGLVLGLLLRGTPWADAYARSGREGHPLYSTAHFYSREEAEALLERAGFDVRRYRSTLFQKPGQEVYNREKAVDSYVGGAGFVAIAAVKVQT